MQYAARPNTDFSNCPNSHADGQTVCLAAFSRLRTIFEFAYLRIEDYSSPPLPALLLGALDRLGAQPRCIRLVSRLVNRRLLSEAGCEVAGLRGGGAEARARRQR